MSVVDNAIYVDGRRKLAPASLDTAFSALRSCPDDGHSFAWIGMLRPGPDEIQAVAQEFDLHALAVEDTVNPTSAQAGAVRRQRCSSCCGPPATSTPSR